MRAAQPDVFINVGDTIYADQPLVAGSEARRRHDLEELVTAGEVEGRARRSTTSAAAYRYNLLDEHMRRFNAEVPQIVMWDDHEVRDNWYPTRGADRRRALHREEQWRCWPRARGRRSSSTTRCRSDADDPERVYRSVPFGPLVEIFALDMRSYRGANSENRQPTLDDDVGDLRARRSSTWLKARADGITRDLEDRRQRPAARPGRAATAPSSTRRVANGDAGAAARPRAGDRGPAHVHQATERIRNVVWITADVHYCAAHHYDPARATFTEFDPFWEFVAGPLNAGTFGPNALDATFGPEVKFTGIPPGMKPNRPPSDGFQFFGQMRIDRRTKAMTVTLHNLAGEKIYSQELGVRS